MAPNANGRLTTRPMLATLQLNQTLNTPVSNHSLKAHDRMNRTRRGTCDP
jgi:hypothetical protein